MITLKLKAVTAAIAALCIMNLSVWGQGELKKAPVLRADSVLMKSAKPVKTISIPPVVEYIIAPVPGKKYATYEATNISGMDMQEAVIGILTNNLPKEKIYVEIEEEVAAVVPDSVFQVYIARDSFPYRVSVADEGVILIEPPVLVINWTEQLAYLSQQEKEDRFFIAAAREYRYDDGRKLVGNQDAIDRLSTGKPITEDTFYYNMQQAGVLNPDFTLTDFRQLNHEQQIKMIELGLKARTEARANAPDVK